MRGLRHRVMTTCGIAAPFLLLAIGFGTGFTIAAALSSTS
ncbi:hypothetical protein SAMN05421870_11881 [Streptomyces qinglanensis]|uniref:Uncharacterized protein n=1 Tax=Streptomyces qinglanensis TaxID=943816 RepID=A0A1H9WJX9_9ACTN|nr:hypothetical protein SAMN05421870_11881 [Streptomyces qinglanensis]